MAHAVLRRGMLLKILYSTDNKVIKWALICSKQLCSKLSINQHLNFDIIDLLREEKFVLEDKKIEGFNYIGMPAGVTTQDLFGETALTRRFGETFLLDNDAYISTLKDHIASEYAKFISFCKSHTAIFEECTNKEVLDNLLFLRFYPEKKNFTDKEVLNIVKKDVTDKYHIWYDDNKPILLALKHFGLTNTALTNTDPVFLNALKIVWKDFVMQHAKKVLTFIATERARYELEYGQYDLVKTDYAEIITKNDLLLYIDQFNDYERAINDMSQHLPDKLNKCSSVMEIFALWPCEVQPQPFLLDEY